MPGVLSDRRLNEKTVVKPAVVCWVDTSAAKKAQEIKFEVIET